MQMSTHLFTRVHPLVLRMLCGTVPTSEDVCLLTHEECRYLSNVVLASDGRRYDALSLQKWLATAHESCVIPACPITSVCFDLPFVHVASIIAATIKFYVYRLAQTIYSIGSRLLRYKKSHKRGRHMLLQVLDCHRRARLCALAAHSRFHHDEMRSPFVCVSRS